MKAWDKQARFREAQSASAQPPMTPTPGLCPPPRAANSSTPSLRTPTPGLCPRPRAANASTTSTRKWTPELIAATAVRWGIIGDTSPCNTVVVRRSPTTNSHILAARADKNGTETVMGWRIQERDGCAQKKILLVPTNAPRSKIHWILSEESTEDTLIWTRAKKVMKWVTLPLTTRRSTFTQRATRLVSVLSPALSPPPLKKQRNSTKGENKGCCCRLGDVCKHLRLKVREEGSLPKGEPRLCRYPSKKR